MNMTNKRQFSREFSVILSSGKSLDVTVSVMLVYDPSFGQDADGNRGIGVWEFDRIDFDLPDILTYAERNEAETLVEDKVVEYPWETP